MLTKRACADNHPREPEQALGLVLMVTRLGDGVVAARASFSWMTSTMILQLAQEGKLRLSDPVSKYVAGVPNGDQITIARLLKMRSGLVDYTGAVAPFLDNEPTKVWTPQ